MKRALILATLLSAAAAHADAPVSAAFAEATHGPASPPTMVAPELAVATVSGWLKGYEFVPSEAHFARIPDLPGVLLTLAAQEDAHPVMRARAISAMIHAPTARTEQRLLEILDAPDALSLLRRKSARVLAQSYGARHMARIAAVFEADEHDARLQEACAWALAEIGPESQAIRQRLSLKAKAPFLQGILKARRVR